jgi:hypothetical protein
MAFILGVASSCVTYQKCVDKFGTLQKPSQVIAKGVLDTTLASIQEPLFFHEESNADSLVQMIHDLQNEKDSIKSRHDSLLMVFGNEKLKTKLWYDRHTNSVRGSTTKKADTVKITLHDTVRVVASCPPSVVFDKKPHGLAKVWNDFQFFAAWALLLGILILLAYLKFKK